MTLLHVWFEAFEPSTVSHYVTSVVRSREKEDHHCYLRMSSNNDSMLYDKYCLPYLGMKGLCMQQPLLVFALCSSK